MTYQQPITYKEQNGVLKMNIWPAESWENFDQIINFLKNSYGAISILEADGIDARHWTLTFNDVSIEAFYDDWGTTWLEGHSEKSKKLIRSIGNNLEQSFHQSLQ